MRILGALMGAGRMSAGVNVMVSAREFLYLLECILRKNRVDYTLVYTEHIQNQKDTI